MGIEYYPHSHGYHYHRHDHHHHHNHHHQVEALQSSIDESVPRGSLEEANRQYNEITAKYEIVLIIINTRWAQVTKKLRKNVTDTHRNFLLYRSFSSFSAANTNCNSHSLHSSAHLHLQDDIFQSQGIETCCRSRRAKASPAGQLRNLNCRWR